MKKALLSILCLLSMNISSNMDIQQMGRQIEAQVAQSATPEALQAVDKMAHLLLDAKLRAQLIAMARSHGKESLTFFAESLRTVLTVDERAQVIGLLDEIYDWYSQFLSMSMDVKTLQTPAGQEAYMQHQFKPLLMLQKPLMAAIAKRVFELGAGGEHNQKMLNDLRAGFHSLVKEQFDAFKTELSK